MFDRNIKSLVYYGSDSSQTLRGASYSKVELEGLQHCCDCLVSPHRSEGFGLNIAEYMALGKPVITTAYSGNMDFTNETTAYLIPYQLTQIKTSSGPYLPGYTWAEPNVDALADLMKRVVQETAGGNHKGRAAAEFVRARFSPEVIGQRIKDRFADREFDRPLPSYIKSMAELDAKYKGEIQKPTYLEFDHLVKFSVVIPVYDVPPKFLEACIRSVFSQSYPRWELCICDDASTRAETLEVLKSYKGTDPRLRIRFLDVNKGISEASNEAASMATGDYLVMLDNGDELTPDALELMSAAISKDRSIDVIYGDEDKLNFDGQRCDSYYKP